MSTPKRLSSSSIAILAGLVLAISTGCAVLGIRTEEEAPFSVVREDGRFELRRYDPLVVVRTSVDAGYEEAGEIAFGRLFAYISGENEARSEIAMTAPVLTESDKGSDGVEVAMTAPVLTESDGASWQVAFVLPAELTPETAPLPTNPLVELDTVPSKLVAAVRFSGILDEESTRDYGQELMAWIEKSSLTAVSEPRGAGYDPPWTLPFLRRNEVLIDVEPAG